LVFERMRGSIIYLCNIKIELNNKTAVLMIKTMEMENKEILTLHELQLDNLMDEIWKTLQPLHFHHWILHLTLLHTDYPINKIKLTKSKRKKIEF
jgi:hypothetical protein